MAGTVVQGEAFERAQERAREERLRKAIETEMAAHRSLCQHYNAALERIAELEDLEVNEITRLEAELGKKVNENVKLQRSLEVYKFGQKIMAVTILVSFALIFLMINNFI